MCVCVCVCVCVVSPCTGPAPAPPPLQVPCAAFVLEGWRKCGHTTAINQPDKEGATPAHYAATLGDPAMLALLVDKVPRPPPAAPRAPADCLLPQGADLSLLDRDGRCPLTWACAAGHAPTVAWVCAQAAMQGAGPAQPHPTTTSADPAQPHPLTTSGAGLAEPSLQPLHAAACVGAEEACRLLLETGAAQVRVECVTLSHTPHPHSPTPPHPHSPTSSLPHTLTPPHPHSLW